LGRVIIDGRATNKYEFVKQIGDWVWVETIFADEQSGIPVRFETRGRSDANAGSITIYRHDTSIRIDPPTVDLEKRWSESLQRLSEEVEKGDPACRAEFFAAVERGRMAAFEFAIKGSFESSLGVAGTFVPSDAIQYWYFGQTLAAGGRTWIKKSWPDGWVEAPGKTDLTDKIIKSLFPPSEYVGRVACSGKVSVDGRDYDSYEYDFYRDSESARALYSHRSTLVEKAGGIPFQTVSVSRTRTPQWVETRRYDPILTIQTPPPESTQRQPSILTPSEIAALLKRGQDYLQNGDIVSARLMLRRAASAGDPQAALLLGATFDPVVLRDLGVLGFTPDPAQARTWYQRAADAGLPEATRRLERLVKTAR
jgi:hypothetical protein